MHASVLFVNSMLDRLARASQVEVGEEHEMDGKALALEVVIYQTQYEGLVAAVCYQVVEVVLGVQEEIAYP